MPDQRRASFIVPVAVTLAVLLGTYVGAYYAMVYPYDGVPLFPTQWKQLAWGYRPAWIAFFSPIHWLDRRIRPDVWEP